MLFYLSVSNMRVGDVYCGIGCSCRKPSDNDTTVNGGNNKNHNNQDNNNDEDKKEDDDAEQQQIEKQFKDNLKAFNAALDDATNNVYDVQNNGFLIISVERCGATNDNEYYYKYEDKDILDVVKDCMNDETFITNSTDDKQPKLLLPEGVQYKDLFKCNL